MPYSFLFSFLIGGALCAVAQLLIDLTPLTPARILVLFVCTGVLLGGVGVYSPFTDFAGCGATVPLLGFGANIARGVKESIDERGALGILTGGFEAASAGCAAALIFGYLFSLVFSGKPKRL